MRWLRGETTIPNWLWALFVFWVIASVVQRIAEGRWVSLGVIAACGAFGWYRAERGDAN